eukprot:5094663-Amphidinium_carterae.1
MCIRDRTGIMHTTRFGLTSDPTCSLGSVPSVPGTSARTLVQKLSPSFMCLFKLFFLGGGHNNAPHVSELQWSLSTVRSAPRAKHCTQFDPIKIAAGSGAKPAPKTLLEDALRR